MLKYYENRIEQGLRQIRETAGMTERVTRSVTRRVQACLQMQGGHFEHLLQKQLKQKIHFI